MLLRGGCNLRGEDPCHHDELEGQYEAATYEFIETPEETGLGDIECRLNLLEIADGTFKDGGHAMAWALKAAE